jgi:hypothetical protein
MCDRNDLNAIRSDFVNHGIWESPELRLANIPVENGKKLRVAVNRIDRPEQLVEKAFSYTLTCDCIP